MYWRVLIASRAAQYTQRTFLRKTATSVARNIFPPAAITMAASASLSDSYLGSRFDQMHDCVIQKASRNALSWLVVSTFDAAQELCLNVVTLGSRKRTSVCGLSDSCLCGGHDVAPDKEDFWRAAHRHTPARIDRRRASLETASASDAGFTSALRTEPASEWPVFGGCYHLHTDMELVLVLLGFNAKLSSDEVEEFTAAAGDGLFKKVPRFKEAHLRTADREQIMQHPRLNVWNIKFPVVFSDCRWSPC